MCTVIVDVPATGGHGGPGTVRLLAVRDEDPARAWDPLGHWWPRHPSLIGVRDARAGGAWLAADTAAGRLAVVLNRADVIGKGPAPASRGALVLDAVTGGGVPERPRTHGFNLVEVGAGRVRVTMWDGRTVRTVDLPPGLHMVAHDDVDDTDSPRIVRWRDDFAAAAAASGPWRETWTDVLARSSALAPTDDAAIIRDNRPHGYPTMSLLMCAAEVTPDAVSVSYAELAAPGEWNAPDWR